MSNSSKSPGTATIGKDKKKTLGGLIITARALISDTKRKIFGINVARCEIYLIIVGLGLTVWQIGIGVRDQREDRSIQFVSQYFASDQGFLNTVIELSELQYSGVRKFQAAFPTVQYKPDPEGFFRDAHPFIKDVFKKEDEGKTKNSPYTKILRIEKYFDNTLYCVERGSCDQDIIRDGLHKEMYAFLNASCSVYEDVRKYFVAPTFLKRTARFVFENRDIDSSEFVCPERIRRLSVEPHSFWRITLRS